MRTAAGLLALGRQWHHCLPRVTVGGPGGLSYEATSF